MVWFSGHESTNCLAFTLLSEVKFSNGTPNAADIWKNLAEINIEDHAAVGMSGLIVTLILWIALWCSLVSSHRCLPGLLAYWSAKSTSFARNQPARSWSVSDNSLTWLYTFSNCTFVHSVSTCFLWYAIVGSQSQIFHMWLWKADVSQVVNILIISLIRRSHKEAIVIRSAYAG